MGNSKMYNEFKEWIDKIGTREGDYYLPYHFLDELNDRERDEVEKIIYEIFNKNEKGAGYFSKYMRYLKNYDGIAALKQYLKEYTNVSGSRFDVITALYEATMDPQYVDMMVGMYKNTRKRSFVAGIKYCTPSEAIFKALAYIYITDGNRTNRSSAIDGLLHCKGYIKKIPYYGKTNENEMKISRLLYFSDNVEERKILVEKLESNQQLVEDILVPETLY